MPETQPLQALRYSLERTGGLQDVVAPPYDVIDADQRIVLQARSPYNVVAIDLPEGGDDRYERAAELLRQWRGEGGIVGGEQPCLGTLQHGPTGPAGER